MNRPRSGSLSERRTGLLSERRLQAERAMMDEEFDAVDSDTLRDIIARLGVADSREFGVTLRADVGGVRTLPVAARVPNQG